MSTKIQQSPNDYPKRILLCSVGNYPQVVTETLYALVTEKGFVPTEIHVIGTELARKNIQKYLLAPEKGLFHILCKNLGIKQNIRFDNDCIHILADKYGQQLTDIRTPEDCIATADSIVGFVRKECEDEDSAMYVCIAGGRKSLSFFLGYILSFFAKPQDLLLHVLVSSEYEFLPDFFYPSQPQQTLTTEDPITKKEKTLLAKDAKIQLAEIPIIRLRNNLPENFMKQGEYSELVSYLDTAIDPIEMRFDLDENTVTCDVKSIVSANETVNLLPGQLSFLLWLALRKKQGKDFVNPNDNEAALEYLDFAQEITTMIVGFHSIKIDYLSDLKDYLFSFKSQFTQAVSRSNKAIRKVLPEIERYSRFQVDSQWQYENGVRFKRYQLVTPVENIVLPKQIQQIKLKQFDSSHLPEKRLKNAGNPAVP